MIDEGVLKALLPTNVSCNRSVKPFLVLHCLYPTKCFEYLSCFLDVLAKGIAELNVDVSVLWAFSVT